MAKKTLRSNKQPPVNGPSKAQPTRSRRRRVWAMTLAVITILTAAGFYFRPQPKIVDLPALKLEGADAEIVKAIEDARAEVQKTPRSGPAWGKLGMVLAIHDYLAEAETCFFNAEQLNPREARWPYMRGLARSGDNAEAAFANFERAAKLCGDLAAPRLRYAEVLIERGQLAQAESQIRRVYNRDSQDARALLGLGRIAFAQGRFTESLDFLKRSAQVMPNVKATHALLATVQQRLGDKAAADESLRRAASLPEATEWPDPFLIEINMVRTGRVAATDMAESLLRKGHPVEAISMMKRTTRSYPNYMKGFLVLGKAAVQTRDFFLAERSLRKAVEMEPTSVEAHVELGNAFFQQAMYKEAATSFREAIQIKPSLAEAHFNLGLALMNQKDNAAAIQAFQTAARYKPDLTYAYIRWGQALGRMERVPEAIEQLRQALRLSPDNSEAQGLLDALLRMQNSPPPPK